MPYQGARVDIAVLNSRFEAYEIKSDQDSLDRLASQLDAYKRIFDRVTVVTGGKHLDKLLGMLPDWAGIQVAFWGSSCQVRLKWIRSPKSNPHVDARLLSTLLWKDELLKLAEYASGRRGLAKLGRLDLADLVSELMTKSELRLSVHYALKLRGDWRLGLRQNLHGDSRQQISM